MNQETEVIRYIFGVIRGVLHDSLNSSTRASTHASIHPSIHNTNEIEKCMICLDKLDEVERIKLKRCNHYYHTDCLRLYAVNQMFSYARKCNKVKRVVSYPIRCPLCMQISRVEIEKKMEECEKMIELYVQSDFKT